MTSYKKLIGRAPVFRLLIEKIELIAASDINVLLMGETGTGKELLAQAIHKNSKRRQQVFLPVNCAVFPEHLIESLLFGSLRGAFTGSDTDRQGIFAVADGGTVFLDEINSLPLRLQAKLLRFIESGEYFPVGGVKVCNADVRIISAANVDMQLLMDQGAFRADLYFRLNKMPILVPPLRERKQDINLLIRYFLGSLAKKYLVKTPVISQEVIEALNQYAWPGNIRELRNICEYLVIQKIRRPILLSDLPLLYRNLNRCKPLYMALPKEGLDWHKLECNLIQQALVRTRGRMSQACKLLGISRDTLVYRIKKYGLS